MCQKVKCPKCKKFTWAGCGLHVEQALAGVPQSERCSCQNQSTSKFNSLASKTNFFKSELMKQCDRFQ